MNKIIYTIGHSTLALEAFTGILKGFGIQKLIDVRTIPGSRFNPQYNKEGFSSQLTSQGIIYQHIPGLGGLRRPKKDSMNGGWKNSSFRGYADYMQTEEFEKNLQKLMEEAQKGPVAIMCAEAVPWRCHRSLIADALLIRDFDVHDIMGTAKDVPHQLNPMAKVHGKIITYPEQ
jgi:uncharacterized protein (DUF488 family)